MSGFIVVGYFLITLFFSLLLFILWGRFALRYFQVSMLNPIAQVIYTITDPLIRPLERLFSPKALGRKRYDWICLGIIGVVECFKFIILGLFLYGNLIPIFYLMLFVVADGIAQPCNFLFYIILFRVIISWVNPFWRNPALDIMRIITEPLLNLGRQLIPVISGIDFSPFVVLIFLKVIHLFMSASLPFS